MMNLDEIYRNIGSQMAGSIPSFSAPVLGSQPFAPSFQTPDFGIPGSFGEGGGFLSGVLPAFRTPFSPAPTQPAGGGMSMGGGPALGGGSSLSPGGTGDQGVLQWTDKINQASAKYGVPADVIAATMHIESHGDPNARSNKGALGQMQVMPFHFKPGENPMDPDTNIDRGTQILADNYAKWGDWDKAAAAYFGALDANGNITNASDGGQNGPGYVKMFNDARALYPGTANRQAPTGPTNQTLSPADAGAAKQDPHGGRASQFDPQLNAAEQLAACGPTAAAAAAGISNRQALDTAKQLGVWDANVGMHGAQSELQLLQRLGVNASLEGVDWNKASAMASPNTPVIVDTPGHYFYIDGASNGNFHVGTSGTDLKRGSEWMTPQQMAAVMGAPRNLIYVGG